MKSIDRNNKEGKFENDTTCKPQLFINRRISGFCVMHSIYESHM